MPEVAYLLAEDPIPARSKVMTQMKRDNLVPHTGGWA